MQFRVYKTKLNYTRVKRQTSHELNSMQMNLNKGHYIEFSSCEVRRLTQPLSIFLNCEFKVAQSLCDPLWENVPWRFCIWTGKKTEFKQIINSLANCSNGFRNRSNGLTLNENGLAKQFERIGWTVQTDSKTHSNGLQNSSTQPKTKERNGYLIT